MSQVGETFFTVVGCMDGRVQGVVAEFGRNKFQAQYADTITEAGLVGKLSKELWEDLRFKVVDVSMGKHNSKGIIVHGHQECAGNLVHDEKHKEDIRKSVELLKTIVGDLSVIGVFVVRSKSDPSIWEVEEV